jgi:hypothetical protein
VCYVLLPRFNLECHFIVSQSGQSTTPPVMQALGPPTDNCGATLATTEENIRLRRLFQSYRATKNCA